MYRRADINDVTFALNGSGLLQATANASFGAYGLIRNPNQLFGIDTTLRLRFNLSTLPPNGNTQVVFSVSQGPTPNILAYLQWENFNTNRVKLEVLTPTGWQNTIITTGLSRVGWYIFEINLGQTQTAGRVFTDLGVLIGEASLPSPANINNDAMYEIGSASDGFGAIFDWVEILFAPPPSSGIQPLKQASLVGPTNLKLDLWQLRIAEPPPPLDMTAARSAGSERVFYEGDLKRGASHLRLVGPMGDLVGDANAHLAELRALEVFLQTAERVEMEVEGVRYYLPLDTSLPVRGYHRRIAALKLSRYSTLELTLAVLHRNWRRVSDNAEFGAIF
ncbi:MAG: hypothetical protein ACRCVX_03610 [Shewanella sp.]